MFGESDGTKDLDGAFWFGPTGVKGALGGGARFGRGIFVFAEDQESGVSPGRSFGIEFGGFALEKVVELIGVAIAEESLAGLLEFLRPPTRFAEVRHGLEHGVERFFAADFG